MQIRRATTFVFTLAIVLLIAGLSACDQIGQLLLPATPQMEGTSAKRFLSALSYPSQDDSIPHLVDQWDRVLN